ncbi:DUF3991 domain-containing protein [Lactococcus allomyrinae]|uniref:DUF3991 domain-containing protein n=1 Tax=Lactococcus allomyrinae TaxID=2419773 RepID=A0A387BJD3_9LACT|nr:DUF3991 domain-containing protein [Lactococcus allomyrinae]AYG01136.1 DUF3991 domain-containing protein [Lactococcus allomyrinae]
MFKKYSDEELRLLNSSDIFQVANSIGLTINDRVDRKGFQRADSLDGKLAFNRSTNTFYDFERQKGGKPLDFLMTWGEKSFLEAVEYLKDNNFVKLDHTVMKPAQALRPEPFVYRYQISSDKTIARNYLVNERKISASLVDKLLQVRLIEQEAAHNNILFHYKKDTRIVGASVQGTYISFDKFGKRGTYKGIAQNSETNFGFHFSFGKPTKFYVFEAPIDAMSYFTFNPKARRDVMYGAMSGLKPETVKNLVDYARSKGNPDVVRDGIYISVDNDAAGVAFWSEYAKHNALTEGGGKFYNNIPDFYSVPHEILSLYQEAAARRGVDFDLTPLLAVHKFETNFAQEKRLANREGYFKFFGEKPKPHPTQISIDELAQQVDRFVGEYLKNDKDLHKTLDNLELSPKVNQNFALIVQDLNQTYKKRLVIKPKKDIQKDWNDVLKKRVQKLQNPVINVSNPRELERVLENFDYQQIAKEDLKAAGITNRKESNEYERAHRHELEMDLE